MRLLTVRSLCPELSSHFLVCPTCIHSAPFLCPLTSGLMWSCWCPSALSCCSDTLVLGPDVVRWVTCGNGASLAWGETALGGCPDVRIKGASRRGGATCEGWRGSGRWRKGCGGTQELVTGEVWTEDRAVCLLVGTPSPRRHLSLQGSTLIVIFIDYE